MILSPDLQDIQRTAQSDAERRLARLLAQISSPDAVAFYSVKLRSHAYKQMAEVDFLVLWKGVVIVVEVKGGGVKQFDRVWYSVDRRGDNHRLPTSPMEQARSAMFALQEILLEDGVGWFATEAVVVTPDIESPPSSLEWKSTHWLANGAMSIAALSAAFDQVARGARTAPKGKIPARADELRTQLFGEFSRMPIVDAQRGAVVDEQDLATDGQARVLAGLARNPRIIVLGGAGTGKSLVLAEAAKQEAAAGRTVLITFRSPGLERFFQPRVADREIDVVAFDSLETHRRYDVVLVDEAQDLMHPEAMDLLDRLVVGGRAAGRWRMFLDPNNQAQVDGRFDADVYELVASEALTYDLSLNVRNTRGMVHMVQEYLGADVGDPGIVNGEKIHWHWIGDEDCVGAALEVAKGLITEGASAKDIWVIPAAGDPDADWFEGAIRVLSPRMAKGLEAEHVIVCDLPGEFDSQGMANLYVAVTRARVALHVVATNADKKRLQAQARLGGK